MLRIKTKWHQKGQTRQLEEIAQTLGFNCWRIAANALIELEKEFNTETYSDRLNIVAEYLAFLLQVTDRILYTQLSAEDRQRFIPALANDMAGRFADNQQDIVGEGEHRADFIALLNQRAADYAEIDFIGDEGGFPFLNFFGQQVEQAMHNQRWISEYIIDIGGPDAVRTLRHNIQGLMSFQAETDAT